MSRCGVTESTSATASSRLEGELSRHKELEHLLRATLLSAEQAANTVREKGQLGGG